MRDRGGFLGAAAALLLAALPASVHAQFPDRQPDHPEPAGYDGPRFELRDEYPQTEPADEPRPWDTIAFDVAPAQYLEAVLDYAIAETTTSTGIRSGSEQPWFHAPWLTPDWCSGRELAHGLTQERYSRPRELAQGQTGSHANWAVGLYDPRGGWTIGRVWPDPNGPPHPEHASFPRGTVAIKFLFTMAPIDEVPFLDRSLELSAHVFPTRVCQQNQTTRQILTVRLLQVDVAVRDDRATETGWVFGTFVYSAAASGSTIWERLVPVTAVWGNDPNVRTHWHDDGAYVNADLQQGWVNDALIAAPVDPHAASVQHFGLAGRGNGPVDNPRSSCVSCHARAATRDMLPQVVGLGMAPSWNCDEDPSTPRPTCDAEFDEYFRNVPQGVGATLAVPRLHHLDYSLQLALGFAAYCRSHATEAVCDPPQPPLPPPPPFAMLARADTQIGVTSEMPSRDEGDAETDDASSEPSAPDAPAASEPDAPDDDSPPTDTADENSLALPLGIGAMIALAVVIAILWTRRRPS